ncbi:hypothetical protein L227DRAFT_608080 [Lentinus tigrinus ALCF2SS1-6]|uniref:Uncharacterized protein n=1 Tax=Lentinus tigrinus ALCF2SS1-6 TaxID=1328759 RepID=A0A5C2SMV0_9APHY|nr:hypothetical protein L227DRAFT_608080 [Lentinus tigrinus ALCF2SS1-6]
MSNNFIPDYKSQVIGKTRTANHPGSHFQYYRDTTKPYPTTSSSPYASIALAYQPLLPISTPQFSCHPMGVIQAERANREFRVHPSAERSSTAASSSSTSSLSGSATSSTQRTQVPTSYTCIGILLDPASPSALHLVPLIFALVHTPAARCLLAPVLRHIDPTVTFVSQAAVHVYSSIKLTYPWCSANEPRFGRSSTDLDVLPNGYMPRSEWPGDIEYTVLYRMPFASRFSESLCHSPLPPDNENHTHPRKDVLFSVIYQFKNLSPSTPPLLPDIATLHNYHQATYNARPVLWSNHRDKLNSSLTCTTSPHTIRDDPHLKPTSLIHVAEDAYASFPPSTSPFQLAAAAA